MKRFLVVLATLGLLPAGVGAVPVPPEPTGPSAEALKLIEARRAALVPLQGTQRESLSPERLAELDRKLQPLLDQLAAALATRDPFIYDEAVRDLVNGNYRAFPPDRIRALLLPRVKEAETNPMRMVAQGWIIEYLAKDSTRARSRDELPDLLRLLGNDKVETYLRGAAATAAAKIAPGDPAVIEAFIAALNNPNPTNTSGVHDRIAALLGNMGKAAAPAKKALVKLFERGDFYQDPVYIALGQIARDETPLKLDESLARLRKLDTLPVDQGAAAFLHIVELGRTGTPDRWVIVPEVVNAARPALLAVIDERPNDVHSRAALRALGDLGPGNSPATAKFLVGSLLKYHAALEAARKEIAAAQPGPEQEAKSKAFVRIYSYNRDELLLAALERIEPVDPASAVPIAEAFGKFAPRRDDWVIAQRLARNLERFGTGARPAVPVVLQVLGAVPLSTTQDVFPELFVDYLKILAAAGGDAPGARRAVLDHLAPTSPTLAKTGPNAVGLRMNLLLTLAKLGLPREGDERTVALRRLRDGLDSDRVEIFSAAAKGVATPTLTPEEAGPVVKALARVLAKDFQFQAVPEEAGRNLRWVFPYEEQGLLGQGLAIRALGAIGPLAREALPEVRALAKQELQTEKLDYRPEPARNFLIREARKAEKQIEGMR
jgi:hypothetical protein